MGDTRYRSDVWVFDRECPETGAYRNPTRDEQRYEEALHDLIVAGRAVGRSPGDAAKDIDDWYGEMTLAVSARLDPDLVRLWWVERGATTMTRRYVLHDGEPVLEPDPVAWARWYEEAAADERVVGRDEPAPGVEVSTVFLLVDHAFGVDPPLLYETMVFADDPAHPLIDEQERYATRQEAEAGHADMVARAKRIAARTPPVPETLASLVDALAASDREQVARYRGLIEAHYAPLVAACIAVAEGRHAEMSQVRSWLWEHAGWEEPL